MYQLTLQSTSIEQTTDASITREDHHVQQTQPHAYRHAHYFINLVFAHAQFLHMLNFACAEPE